MWEWKEVFAEMKNKEILDVVDLLTAPHTTRKTMCPYLTSDMLHSYVQLYTNGQMINITVPFFYNGASHCCYVTRKICPFCLDNIDPEPYVKKQLRNFKKT